MSANSKGALLERQAKELLESEGYLVHRTIRTPIVKWLGGATKVIGSHNNDVFGVFDLIAGQRNLGFRFIQVTTVENVSARRHKVEEVAKRLPDISGVTYEVWGWVAGRRRRHATTGEFLRRQYFQTHTFVMDEWIDTTPDNAGRIDK